MLADDFLKTGKSLGSCLAEYYLKMYNRDGNSATLPWTGQVQTLLKKD